MSHARAWSKGALMPVLPVALAAVLCFLFLGRKSFWGDEAFSVELARLGWGDFWHVLSNRQANMGAYYALLKGWIELGESETVIRSLSAIAGVASVAATYALAARLFGRSVGITAALLLAVNAFLIRYAQEARAYELALLTSSVASLLFVRLTASPRSRALWLSYVAVAALSVYFHLFSAFVLMAHALTLVLLPDRTVRARIAAAGGVVFALVTPLLLFIAVRDEGQVDRQPAPTPQRVVAALGSLSGGTAATLAVYSVLASIALVTIWRLYRDRPANDRWRYGFLLSLLLVPILGSIALGLVKPFFVARYLIVALPALAILVAVGIHALRPRLAVAALAVVMVASVHALADWYEGEEKEGLDFRAAAAHVAANSADGDGIVFYRASRRLPIEYYFRRRGLLAEAPVPLFPSSSWGRYDLIGDYESRRPRTGSWDDFIDRAAANHPRVWLVHGDREFDLRELGALQGALGAHYARREARKYGELTVALFSDPAETATP